MLALTRKPGEEILIGGNIVIRIVRCQGGRCRLGIEAPRDIKISRGELGPKVPATDAGNREFVLINCNRHGMEPDGDSCRFSTVLSEQYYYARKRIEQLEEENARMRNELAMAAQAAGGE